jgi:AcrR family transcriptional regulator
VSRVARPREYDDRLRVRLVDEAARLLAEEGPAALTTRRVAAAVGTSTTAIYSLVGSKDDLVHAACLEGFARLAAHQATVEPSDDPLGDLRRLGHAYLDMALESPALYRVMFGQVASDGSHAALRPGDERIGVETLQVLVDGVRRAIDAGQLTGEPFPRALQLWSLSHGVASLAITGMLGPPATAHQLLDEACAAIITGLAPNDGTRID